MSYTGSIPDTVSRDHDWRDLALCKADPESMYPDNSKEGIRAAKDLCSYCPARLACLVDALRAGDNQWGIRGGLTPEQRRKVADRLTDAPLDDPAAVEDAVYVVLHPHTANRTLADLWNDHAYVTGGGHMGWQGAGSGGSFSWKGQVYTPNQVAFLVDRGHAPDGQVRRICEIDGCVHPRHIADTTERAAAKTAARRAKAPA